MLLGTLKGILVSIIVSLVALMHQAANPQVYSLVRKRGTNVFRPRSEEHADDESFPGLLVLRPEGRLFFVNMERVMDKMRPLVTDANPEVVVLDLSAVFDLEYTALKALTTAEQRLRDRGVSMWVAGLTPDVFAMVRRSPLGDVLGDQRMLFNVEVAVARFLASRRNNARIEM
jgi:SulP family sulfate permease